MKKVGVVGATGYAGAELVRILSGHPDVELAVAASRQYAGLAFSDVYPSMAGVVDIVCEEPSVERISEKSDIVFLALPHKLPMEIVPQFLERGKRVVDLSADFRFKNAASYASAYQPHTSANLLAKAEYGLCEVYRDRIRDAAIIGNPGCYPTSALLPLIPLLKAKLIDPEMIVIDSKSGVSGAGRGVSLTTHYCEVNESHKAYKVGTHRHTPEIEEILSREHGKPVSVTFVPHLVPMTRGMLTTTYAKLAHDTADETELADMIRSCLDTCYADRPFVRIRPDGKPPDTLHVRGGNFCDIGFKADCRNKRLILISAIDNLVKGAAGQAVQNMNIMLGIDETTGLSGVPYPI